MWGFFNEILVRPLWNALVLITDVIPGHWFALGIVILTIVIRLVLLGPAGKAIKSQREMQRITPQLDKIKKQFAGNQQKIAEETMKLFKEHKVNPLGGVFATFDSVANFVGILLGAEKWDWGDAS